MWTTRQVSGKSMFKVNVKSIENECEKYVRWMCKVRKVDVKSTENECEMYVRWVGKVREVDVK